MAETLNKMLFADITSKLEKTLNKVLGKRLPIDNDVTLIYPSQHNN